jgi:hypothetical protein
MMNYRAWFRACATITCWLTVLASADDFDLARVVLPLSAPVPDRPLPLDDPNSDFTAGGTEARSLTTSHQGSPSPPVAAGLKWAGTSLVPPPAPLAHSHLLRAGINIPLRC